MEAKFPSTIIGRPFHHPAIQPTIKKAKNVVGLSQLRLVSMYSLNTWVLSIFIVKQSILYAWITLKFETGPTFQIQE